MLNNKEKYIAFCATTKEIPIFFQPWWLDAVCVDGNWDVCVYEEKGKVLGVLPFYQTTYKGKQVIRMPKLTPFLGVLFFPSKPLSPSSQFAFENKVTDALIEQLPPTSYFQQNQQPNLTNWSPFFWAGFKQTTKYTYQINLTNPESIFPAFRQNLKRNLKKAEQELNCIESDDLALFYAINHSTFTKQEMDIPYSFDFLQQLDNTLKSKNRRKIFFTFNADKVIVAAGYYIWDNHTAYYLAGGHTGNREAMSWTMWQAIQYFSNKVQVFDFEGSMIKNIAHFFSGFGATPVPYHHITKGKNKLIDVLKILKS